MPTFGSGRPGRYAMLAAGAFMAVRCDRLAQGGVIESELRARVDKVNVQLPLGPESESLSAGPGVRHLVRVELR